MITTRNALVAVALAFGVWEASDIPHTGIPAAVFSVLYLLSAVWVVRRGSRLAALGIALLSTVEATQAHTWKGVGTPAKDAAEILGTAGVLTAVAFLFRGRSAASAIPQQGVER